jgi:hypothetical protein
MPLFNLMHSIGKKTLIIIIVWFSKCKNSKFNEDTLVMNKCAIKAIYR